MIIYLHHNEVALLKMKSKTKLSQLELLKTKMSLLELLKTNLSLLELLVILYICQIVCSG